MKPKDLFGKLRNQFFSKWIACSIISDKKSVGYGIRFSYPVYILIVVIGILLRNPYILSVAAVIAFLGIKLPLHPFDYVYNYFAGLVGAEKIPGRGSELQVTSCIALILNLIVIALLVLGIAINYEVLALTYVLATLLFTGSLLTKK